MKSRHAVCFGLGDGTDHLIINKDSGEVNRMRDDGINYYQDLLVIPPDKVAKFAAELAMARSSSPEPGPGNESPFPRQAP